LEANSSSAGHEIARIIWHPTVHYHIHNSPSLDLILSQWNPLHAIPSYLRSILALFFNLRLSLPSNVFPSCFPTKILESFLSSPVRFYYHP